MAPNTTMRSRHLVLFGAASGTGNLGVSALSYATINCVMRRIPDCSITVFDYQRGTGLLSPDWPRVHRAGAMRTKRCYRPESHRVIEAALFTNLPISASARILAAATAVLDISGGDSFTDLYGTWRLKSVVWPKLTAMRLGKPLVLLPQTYGPFRSASSRDLAARICRHAAAAWARDERSFEVLRDLLGGDFDPERHRCGVDVAFLLPTREPDVPVGDRLQAWLEHRSESEPLVGLNVSGLLYNDPEGAKSRYGFVADYRELCRGLVERLAAEGARVVLTPHVVSPRGHYESDIEASERLVESLPADAAERVVVAPAFADPREVKWLIGRCDWFCGTRMHSTIAGLSQAVPTAAVSYSMKTAGVFESCGQGERVADPRASDTADVVHQLLASFAERRSAQAHLAERLPRVMATAETQMDMIAGLVCAVAGRAADT